VNGVRTIDAVIEQSELDRYTATRLLFDCARNGWVRRLRSSASTRRADVIVPGEFRLRWALGWLVPVAAILLVSVLFSNVLRDRRRDDLLIGEWRNRIERLEAARERERIRLAVEVYRVNTGRYPEDLLDLVETDLVPQDALRRDAGLQWEYTLGPEGESFALLPAPPPAAAAAD
jgi:hypothetical protein